MRDWFGLSNGKHVTLYLPMLWRYNIEGKVMQTSATNSVFSRKHACTLILCSIIVTIQYSILRKWNKSTTLATLFQTWQTPQKLFWELAARHDIQRIGFTWQHCKTAKRKPDTINKYNSMLLIPNSTRFRSDNW